MTFPDEHYGVIGAFADDYFDHLAGAAASVDRAALAAAVAALLDDPARAAVMAEKGRRYATSSADVTERVAERVLSYLQAPAGEADAAA